MARVTPGQAEASTDDVRNSEEPTPKFVEWTGDPVTGKTAAPFEERVLTRADLKGAYDVDLPEGMARLTWNQANRHRIPVSELTPEVVKVLTENETGFKLTDKH